MTITSYSIISLHISVTRKERTKEKSNRVLHVRVALLLLRNFTSPPQRLIKSSQPDMISFINRPFHSFSPLSFSLSLSVFGDGRTKMERERFNILSPVYNANLTFNNSVGKCRKVGR